MKNRKIIVTEIIINAPAGRVWSVLTNLAGYEKWNPFLIKSEGEIKANTKLINVMRNGTGTMTFKPVVQRVEPMVYFDWIGHLFLPGIFDGHYYFKIQTISDSRVKLIHGELFSGILSSFIFRKIRNDTRLNFAKMNQALKNEVEKSANQ
ncbi:MAG TPA: SRPBCC domain-containing protein [Cyclobacteriaceae bacterium]|nr:SRPBCC domain-containing protein [Cyclobacteriaceae bacterium]